MGKAEFDKLMDHEYDGIREYDNPLPSWWSGVFIVTILFSGVYWLYYHWGGPGKSETEVYAEELVALEKTQAAELAKAGNVDEATLAKLAANASALEKGKNVFAANCVACHLKNGQGNVGPNLTDEYQILGTTRMDIYNTLMNGGRPGKGMQSWKKQLKPDEIMSVAAFVSTLRGKNLPGKPAEGQKVGPFP
jgi:cytochrome c oxidase cbb3-type subunit 3